MSIPSRIFRNYTNLEMGDIVALGWLSVCSHRLCYVCAIFYCMRYFNKKIRLLSMKKIFTSLLVAFSFLVLACFSGSCKDDDDDKGNTEVLNDKEGTNSNEKTGVVDNGALVVASYWVSDTKRVYFSQGNLQFNAVQGTHDVLGGTSEVAGAWRFAENQYDYIGKANSNISESYDGWIDLFGWGTSGWSSGATAYQPWSISTSYLDYYPGNNYSHNLTDTYAKADWGVYNAISNGGNTPNKWRTLTMSEWQYLFKNNKWTLGYIKDGEDIQRCFMLIPQGFTAPNGVNVTVISTSLSLSDGYTSGFTTISYVDNIYTTEQFSSLEKLGVVALPCGGYRDGTTGDVGFGYYWSSSAYSMYSAYGFYFYSTGVVSYYNSYRYYGGSVRLVRDL